MRREAFQIMTMFLGTHPSRIDSKGRLSIPAPFRAVLKQKNAGEDASVILRPSHLHACVEGWTADTFSTLSESLMEHDPFSSEFEDLSVSLYADAYPVNCDPEGRISLPKSLKQHASLAGAIVFMGLGRIFQIWSPEAAEKRRQDARKRSKKIGQLSPSHPQKEARG